MFDMLTLDELYALHTTYFKQGDALHKRLMVGDTNLIRPLSDEWNLISAKIAEISEAMGEVGREIDRREAERASTDA